MQEVKIYAVLFRSVSFLFYCRVCIWPREAGNAVEDCEDLQTINLQAEKGDMYTVHFSYRTPDKLKFIQPDDKVKNKRSKEDCL